MERLLELVKQAMRKLRNVLVDFYLIIDNNDNKKKSCIIVNVNIDIFINECRLKFKFLNP